MSLVENRTYEITVRPVGTIQFHIFSPGSAECDSSIRVEPRVLGFLTAPAAAGWLHCISSHHGAHPETVKTEELTWMESCSLWD